jgi:Ca-activated chloride channel family protein
MKLILLLFSQVLSVTLYAQIADQQLYHGNKLYAKGKYKEAEQAYQKAYTARKSREAQYNLGNALYQQKSYEKAAKQYESAANNSTDRSLKSFSNHNIGNTFLEQKKWDDAIQYYKQSLKINPNSADTKYNLAYSQKMKQQQDQQKDKNKDKQQNQQDQQKQDQQKQDEQKQDQQKQDQPKQGEKPEEKKDEKPQPMPSKLTKEQADQLLNALNQEEKKLRENKDKAGGQPVKLDKDW